MLNSALVRDAVVVALRAIPEVVEMMAGDGSRIVAHHFSYGMEFPLLQAVAQMEAPSILVVWRGQVAGARAESGQSLVKHRIELFARLGNTAKDAIPKSLEDLWWAITNGIPAGESRNIRYLNLLPDLELMDTPYPSVKQDEEGGDILTAEFLIPEIGDN